MPPAAGVGLEPDAGAAKRDWARCMVRTGVSPRGSRARKKIYHRGRGDRSTESTESYCAALQSAGPAFFTGRIS